MGERAENDATVIKRRIEARNFGGDNATAAADLMCAFVLISVKSGAPPGPERWKVRSKTFVGMAEAWADQYGGYAMEVAA